MKIYVLIISSLLCSLSFAQATPAWKRDDAAATTEKSVLSSLNEARTAHEQSVKEWWNSVYDQYGQSGNALTARDVSPEHHAPWHPPHW
ncbi:hypothetical protein INT48_006011 [Thamnidium elegans]|uniref:Uncharacterized protein n=1 Tax=Thamnidium elegans TaxID=101142 RepID=A0A8H7STP6_9FUNG|nr:hypothetical protein INT48_006011 [Thamnidium elegans]